jgi:hypothetical protein
MFLGTVTFSPMRSRAGGIPTTECFLHIFNTPLIYNRVQGCGYDVYTDLVNTSLIDLLSLADSRIEFIQSLLHARKDGVAWVDQFAACGVFAAKIS